MCNSPIETQNGTLACKRCNDCVAAMINTWSGRACAEKATSVYTYAVTLTYANDTQEKRDGATVFRYSDIKKLLKLIRFHGNKKVEGDYFDAFFLSYIVAGEFGSKKGRVHWHAILFSNHDLLNLGDFHSSVTKKEITEREEKITIDPNNAKRLEWSLWPWGHVVYQEPDSGGVNYVLKYAFKDMFNSVKSEGTARYSKSENYAAGFFRMSKKPPIGARWLDELIRRLAVSGSVLPSLRLRTEGFKGYWVPQGYLRDKLLDAFKAINQASLDYTGVPVPQWNSLLHSVADQKSVFERLSHGEEDAQAQFDDLRRSIELRSKEYDAKNKNRSIRQRCGGAFPCTNCTRGLSPATFERTYAEITSSANAAGGIIQYERSLRKARTCNAYCQLAERPEVVQAFTSLA